MTDLEEFDKGVLDAQRQIERDRGGPHEATIPGIVFVEHDQDTAGEPPASWFVTVTEEQAAEITAFMDKHYEDYNPWVGPVVAIPFEQFKREVMDNIYEEDEEDGEDGTE